MLSGFLAVMTQVTKWSVEHLKVTFFSEYRSVFTLGWFSKLCVLELQAMAKYL